MLSIKNQGMDGVSTLCHVVLSSVTSETHGKAYHIKTVAIIRKMKLGKENDPRTFF